MDQSKQKGANAFFTTFNQESSVYSRTLVVWHSVTNKKATTITVPGGTYSVSGGGGGDVTIPSQVISLPQPSEVDLFEPFFVAPFHVTLLDAVMYSTPTIEDQAYIDINYFFAGQLRVHAPLQRVWGPPSPYLPGGELMAYGQMTGSFCDIPVTLDLVQPANFNGVEERLYVEEGERVGLYPNLDDYTISEMNFDCITVGLLFGYN